MKKEAEKLRCQKERIADEICKQEKKLMNISDKKNV